MARIFLGYASVLGFLAVALGAFAAHGLRGKLDEYYLKVFHTGVEYQFYHVLALALVAVLLSVKGDSTWLKLSGWSFFVGILVFSGSLYLLVATQVKVWGAVTPLGGVLFLIGWALLFVSVLADW